MLNCLEFATVSSVLRCIGSSARHYGYCERPGPIRSLDSESTTRLPRIPIDVRGQLPCAVAGLAPKRLKTLALRCRWAQQGRFESGCDGWPWCGRPSSCGVLFAVRAAGSVSSPTARGKEISVRGSPLFHVEPRRVRGPGSKARPRDRREAHNPNELGMSRARRVQRLGFEPRCTSTRNRGGRTPCLGFPQSWRLPCAIVGLRRAASGQACQCPTAAMRRPGWTRPPANSEASACPGPDARSSRSTS